MKSNIEVLEKRGWVENRKNNKFIDLSVEKLLDICVNSKVALERSLAVDKLGIITKEIAVVLLECLAVEKALYTKIYICELLQTGNKEIASLMIPYLGKIGTNQYKELPKKTSEKISYPLPRDIIARTLSKMDDQILNILLQELMNSSIKEEQLSELIDAIGYLCFYSCNFNRDLAYQSIIKIMKKYQENNLILWKFLTCLSSFFESVDVLMNYCEHLKIPILQLEAKRSLKLIQLNTLKNK